MGKFDLQCEYDSVEGDCTCQTLPTQLGIQIYSTVHDLKPNSSNIQLADYMRI